ncbi:hypothetical protein GCM10018952_53170 [Streptosporangium vulgare]
MSTKTLDEPARRFEELLGPGSVITDPVRLRTYECDGLTHHRATPGVVVLPSSAEQVAAVVRVCNEYGLPFVARGAGTGLSGGALPRTDGVLVVTSKMRRILSVDVPNRRATVEPGVTNLAITEAVRDLGYYYAPDPSSQQVCTIGGNVAENSGGAHCLKYGFTVNHVVGLEIVTPDGDIVELSDTDPGYDLLGAFVGSEGTLGIATKVVVRLSRLPESVTTLLAAFEDIERGGQAVSAIIGGGIVPAAIEMMDALAVEAAEAAVACAYPEGAGAVLIVELGRSRRGGGAPVRRGDAALPGERRVRDTGRRRPGGAGRDLAGPQVGVRRGGPDQPRLHRPGRRRPPDRAARGAGEHRRPLPRVRHQGGERLPRR